MKWPVCICGMFCEFVKQYICAFSYLQQKFCPNLLTLPFDFYSAENQKKMLNNVGRLPYSVICQSNIKISNTHLQILCTLLSYPFKVFI